jgi:hypothetical protein
MSRPLQIQGDLLTERGYTVQVATAERPTTWSAELRIGVYEGERLNEKANPIRREFSKHEGLLNHLMGMEQEARDCAPIALLELMEGLAEQVGKTLREPLHASDIEIILSTASNVRGLFAGVKDARRMAHAVPGAPRAWTLVLEALDGRSYDELVELLETTVAKRKGGVQLKPGDRVGLAIMTALVVGAYVSRNAVNPVANRDTHAFRRIACRATIRMGVARQSGWESDPSLSCREGGARP